MKRFFVSAILLALVASSTTLNPGNEAVAAINSSLDLRTWSASSASLAKSQKTQIRSFLRSQTSQPQKAICTVFHAPGLGTRDLRVMRERAKASCAEIKLEYPNTTTSFGTRITSTKSMRGVVRISLTFGAEREPIPVLAPEPSLPTVPIGTGCDGRATQLSAGLFSVRLRVISELEPSRPLRSSGAFQLTPNGWKYLPGDYAGFITVVGPVGSHALDTLPGERSAYLSKRMPYNLMINADGTFRVSKAIQRGEICDLLVGASPQAVQRWKQIRSSQYKPAFSVSPAAIPSQTITYRAPVSVLRSEPVDLKLYPWEGRHVVLLTSGNDHNPLTIAKYLESVDRAWEFYDQMTGQFPKLGPDKSVWSRTHNGKAIIAAIPNVGDVDSSKLMSCGGNGCGAYETLGIELRWQVVESSLQMIEAFDMYDHTVFYELGRTFWNEAKCGPPLNMKQGDTVTPTGFAVLMRYVSMETIGLTLAPEHEIDGTEFKSSLMSLEEGLASDPALSLNSMTNPLLIRGLDRNAVWASLMNRVGQENGGVTFYSKFFQNCAAAPRATSSLNALSNWKRLAELAAGKNLDAIFVSRWRFAE